MDLQEFVRTTLVQITRGVQDAQTSVRENGGYVSPPSHSPVKNEAHFDNLHDGQVVFLVDFDVAVTVNETTGTNAEAKLKVGGLLSLGAGGKSGDSHESVSRIKFKVPLALPVDPVAKQNRLDHVAEQARDFQNARARRN